MCDSNKFDLINLQYPDDAKASKVAKHQAKKLKNIPGINLKDDFSKVIALIDCCDLIISIDNTIAHIASALGKQTIVLLPLAPPNFRWLLNGRNTPWYPNTTSLIRKDKIGDWSNVLKELKLELEGLELRKCQASLAPCQGKVFQLISQKYQFLILNIFTQKREWI